MDTAPNNPLADPRSRERLRTAIREAELATSGEIRVHVELHCPIDVLDRAAKVFRELGMHRTAARNGVLFYVAVKDRKFAIIGDMGINAAVGEGFWDSIRDAVKENFSKGQFIEGLEQGISVCGDKLKTFFPHQADDRNELSDEVTFGDPQR